MNQRKQILVRIDYEDWLLGIEKRIVWSELVRQLIKDYMSIEQKHSPEIEELEKEIARGKKLIEEQQKILNKNLVQISIKRLRQQQDHDTIMKELPAIKRTMEASEVLNADL